MSAASHHAAIQAAMEALNKAVAAAHADGCHVSYQTSWAKGTTNRLQLSELNVWERKA